MTKHILITGGCGFIGSNIVNKLVNNGYYVTVVDDLSSGSKEYIQTCLKGKNCQLFESSIIHLESLEKVMDGIDVVIHEAANPDVRASKDNLFKDFEINVKGTLNVLQAMVKNGVPKIIFASSGGTVYGETDQIPTPENHPLAPISHYGASKAACEQYLSSFSSLYGVEACSLRLGNIYGPPSNHGVIYDFFWKLKKDPTSLEILGNGKQVKSYLYVDDCVEAHMLALKTALPKYVAFNIASIEGTTVNTIATEVISAMGLKEVKLRYTGGERGWEGDVKKAVVDISKAHKILHWSPQTKINEGIKRYISWLKEKYPQT
ncbi:MAG: SDR family NAD(P)-dependent oxidoreductase [Candidatus Heimdallarchaeota archaeon]|nr:SDR family NAD(P)-dependent oxidoreductase [Candidatus Heimdallarchaeota archaeon]